MPFQQEARHFVAGLSPWGEIGLCPQAWGTVFVVAMTIRGVVHMKFSFFSWEGEGEEVPVVPCLRGRLTPFQKKSSSGFDDRLLVKAKKGNKSFGRSESRRIGSVHNSLPWMLIVCCM